MSRANLESGRTNQKFRTRLALLQAARELMEQGTDPSIDSVAEVAMVSRATAYRYFPSAEKLVVEAVLDAAFDDDVLDASFLDSDDVVERVSQVQKFLYDHARENEVKYRLLLSSAHKEWVESEGKSDVRGGRRLPMIEKALEPVRDQLDGDTYRKLLNAIAGMTGIDSLTMMRDICGLDHDEAKATMNWAVRRLVSGVIEGKS